MAAFKLGNRIKCATATTGTGTITIGNAEDGFQSFANGGIADSDVVRYTIEDGNDFEIGNGTFTSSGPTLTRTLLESSTGSLLNLSGDSIVFVTAATEDMVLKDASTGDVDLGTGKILFSNVYSGTSDLPNATDYHGMFAHVHAFGAGYFAHGGAWYRLAHFDSSGDLLRSTSSSQLGSSSIRWENAWIDDRIYSPEWGDHNDTNDYAQWNNGTHNLGFFWGGTEMFRMEGLNEVFHSNGNITAYSTSIASDERLKENIEVVSGLDILTELDGVTFNWKRNGKPGAGVIAQQLQKVLPEAVGTTKDLNTEEEHLIVDYNAVIAILIESVKELKAEVEELKNASSV
jgi:hypothetical protein